MYQDHFAATSKMVYFGPSSAKTAFSASPFGTTFSVVPAKFDRFSKARFLPNPGAPPKNTTMRMGAAQEINFGLLLESPLLV